jgi:hypothetical protein
VKGKRTGGEAALTAAAAAIAKPAKVEEKEKAKKKVSTPAPAPTSPVKKPKAPVLRSPSPPAGAGAGADASSESTDTELTGVMKKKYTLAPKFTKDETLNLSHLVDIDPKTGDISPLKTEIAHGFASTQFNTSKASKHASPFAPELRDEALKTAQQMLDHAIKKMEARLMLKDEPARENDCGFLQHHYIKPVLDDDKNAPFHDFSNARGIPWAETEIGQAALVLRATIAACICDETTPVLGDGMLTSSKSAREYAEGGEMSYSINKNEENTIRSTFPVLKKEGRLSPCTRVMLPEEFERVDLLPADVQALLSTVLDNKHAIDKIELMPAAEKEEKKGKKKGKNPHPERDQQHLRITYDTKIVVDKKTKEKKTTEKVVYVALIDGTPLPHVDLNLSEELEILELKGLVAHGDYEDYTCIGWNAAHRSSRVILFSRAQYAKKSAAAAAAAEEEDEDEEKEKKPVAKKKCYMCIIPFGASEKSETPLQTYMQKVSPLAKNKRWPAITQERKADPTLSNAFVIAKRYDDVCKRTGAQEDRKIEILATRQIWKKWDFMNLFKTPDGKYDFHGKPLSQALLASLSIERIHALPTLVYILVTAWRKRAEARARDAKAEREKKKEEPDLAEQVAAEAKKSEQRKQKEKKKKESPEKEKEKDAEEDEEEKERKQAFARIFPDSDEELELEPAVAPAPAPDEGEETEEEEVMPKRKKRTKRSSKDADD